MKAKIRKEISKKILKLWKNHIKKIDEDLLQKIQEETKDFKKKNNKK